MLSYRGKKNTAACGKSERIFIRTDRAANHCSGDAIGSVALVGKVQEKDLEIQSKCW